MSVGEKPLRNNRSVRGMNPWFGSLRLSASYLTWHPRTPGRVKKHEKQTRLRTSPLEAK